MKPDTQRLTTSGLNLIAQALSIYDADLRLAVCNLRFQKMFDLPEALVTRGAPFDETIRLLVKRGEYGDVDDPEKFVAERVETALAFEPHYIERMRSSGETISIEGSPLPQGGWVTVYTDITQVKAQEALLRARATELSDQVLSHTEALAATNRELAATNAALQEAQRQLLESEARIRLTTEMMPAHLAHADAAGRYTYSNRRLNGIMPGRSSDIVGLDFQAALGPEAYARIKPSLSQAYSGESAVCEFTDTRSARRIRAAFTPDGSGGVYVLSTDVTKETQARVALQQTHRRELAAQMTSGLAHDFSNLLTIILGLQTRLARLDDLPDRAREMVSGIEAAARRGGQLLDGIADVTGRAKPRPAAVNVRAMLSELSTLAAPTLPPDMRLSVESDVPEGLYLLDAGQVLDCLLNLILNARDASRTGGVIAVKAIAVSQTWLEFSVSDSGPGFSDLALEKACDPFFTTKGQDGTGLGLAMVYDLTKMAGGDLRLGNTSQGAQVLMRLPMRPAPVDPGGLVLLVEDSDTLRIEYRSMIMSLGHAVIEAESVEEARALLSDVPGITLVVSDLRLKGEPTGADLARDIQSRLPVVLMTSLPASDPVHLEAARIAPVLQKPFDTKDLARLLAPEKAI